MRSFPQLVYNNTKLQNNICLSLKIIEIFLSRFFRTKCVFILLVISYVENKLIIKKILTTCKENKFTFAPKFFENNKLKLNKWY